MKRTAVAMHDMAGQPPNKNKRINHEPASSAENRFPRWLKGTVWIQLTDNPRYQYQLHKAVLERTSTWFGEELRKKIDESGTVAVEAPSQGVKYMFILEDGINGGLPVLVRKVSARRNRVRYSAEHSHSRSIPKAEQDRAFRQKKQGSRLQPWPGFRTAVITQGSQETSST